jgi:hypothetical protein
MSKIILLALLTTLVAAGHRALNEHSKSERGRAIKIQTSWIPISQDTMVSEALSGHDMTFSLGHRNLNRTSKQVKDCSDVGSLSTPDNPYGACHAVVHRCNPANGIVNYLALPYCAMPERKWLAFTILLIWVLILCIWIFSIVDFLCPNLVAMTDVCQMRESVAGVTFLAFGHGSPEVFDMVASALLDSNGMAMAIGQVQSTHSSSRMPEPLPRSNLCVSNPPRQYHLQRTFHHRPLVTEHLPPHRHVIDSERTALS